MTLKSKKRNKLREKNARDRASIGRELWPYGKDEKRMLMAPVPAQNIYE